MKSTRLGFATFAVLVACGASPADDGSIPPVGDVDIDGGVSPDGSSPGQDGSTSRDGGPLCSDCKPDQGCDNGVCVDLPSQCPCPKHSFCDLETNSCKPGCRSDEHCNTNAGEVCDPKAMTCRLGCHVDTECPIGERCSVPDVKCVPGCMDDSRCPVNTYCDRSQLACAPGLRWIKEAIEHPTIATVSAGCSAGGTVYYATDYGIYRRTGQGTWTLLRTLYQDRIPTMWASSANDLYVYEAESDVTPSVDRLVDGSWKLEYLPRNSYEQYRGMWGSSATNVYIVGQVEFFNKIPHIAHSTGNGTWTDETAVTGATNKELEAIWGSSASDIYAVGQSGTILHSTGNGSWSGQTSGTTTTLRAVWGSSAGNIYAAGDGGVLLRSTGSGSWSPVVTGTTENLVDIWGSSASDVYVIGGSIVLHWDGAAWKKLNTTVTGGWAIWATGPKDVYIGAKGALFHGQ